VILFSSTLTHKSHNNRNTVNKLVMFAFEQKLTEDDEFSNVVFVKLDTDELEVRNI